VGWRETGRVGWVRGGVIRARARQYTHTHINLYTHTHRITYDRKIFASIHARYVHASCVRACMHNVVYTHDHANMYDLTLSESPAQS